jgi:hypothetical protein
MDQNLTQLAVASASELSAKLTVADITVTRQMTLPEKSLMGDTTAAPVVPMTVLMTQPMVLVKMLRYYLILILVNWYQAHGPSW